MTALYSYLIFIFYRALVFTWRLKIVEHPEFKKKLSEDNGLFVAAHWHGDELGIVHLLGRYKISCIVSTSKDGELMAGVIKLFGAKTSRGSSSKKSIQALLGIIRLTKEGWNPSVAVDGPKGPLHEVKNGVFEIAKTIQAPIHVIAMASSNSFVFKKSWNKAELPLPFSKVVIVWTEAMPAPREAKDPQNAILLAAKIHSAKALAKSLLNTKLPQK